MSEVKKLNPFAGLLERHVDDAAFLWVLRSVAVDQPQYGLIELKKLEARIEKHIDALMLSPDDAWGQCIQAAEFEEAGEAFVLAIVAFRLRDSGKIQKAAEFGLSNQDCFKGLSSALAWLPEHFSMPWVTKFLKSKDLDHKHLALTYCSLKREDPGEYFQNIFTRDDCLSHIPLYARALRLVGELKRRDLVPAVNKAMDHENPDIVFWANWSAVLLGNRAAVEHLKAFVLNDSAHQKMAIELVFRALSVSVARQWVSELARMENTTRQMIWALAALGDPQAVPWLIGQMKEVQYARAAGEAFSIITGIDLEHYQLINELPDLSDEVPDEDDGNDTIDYGMDDENLPWPNTEKVAAVWQT